MATAIRCDIRNRGGAAAYEGYSWTSFLRCVSTLCAAISRLDLASAVIWSLAGAFVAGYPTWVTRELSAHMGRSTTIHFDRLRARV